jgi:hypothetical protein
MDRHRRYILIKVLRLVVDSGLHSLKDIADDRGITADELWRDICAMWASMRAIPGQDFQTRRAFCPIREETRFSPMSNRNLPSLQAAEAQPTDEL